MIELNLCWSSHPAKTAEAISAMKTSKAACLECAITEDLQGGGDQMIDIIDILHAFCSEVYTNMSLPK